MNTELYIDLLEKEVTELRLLIKTSELVLSRSGETPSKPSAPAIPKGTV